MTHCVFVINILRSILRKFVNVVTEFRRVLRSIQQVRKFVNVVSAKIRKCRE